jgi:tRNA pseudouridine38-40 synthase
MQQLPDKNLSEVEQIRLTRRYAACVEYSGSDYCGWQRQDHSPSVQATVEEALSIVADHPIKVICAGRTDTGVHATGQIIHFDSDNPRAAHNWTRGATSNLPDDICIRWTKEVSEDFHARFSAVSRTYRYLLLCRKSRTAIAPQAITVTRVEQIDLGAVQQGLDLLVGKHDFSSFRGAHCQASSPVRDIQRAIVEQIGPVIQVEIRANAFLLHMVRNIVGALLSLGSGEISLEDFDKIFRGLDRTKAPAAALPNGLYLSKVEYPAKFELPEAEGGLWLSPTG